MNAHGQTSFRSTEASARRVFALVGAALILAPPRAAGPPSGCGPPAGCGPPGPRKKQQTAGWT